MNRAEFALKFPKVYRFLCRTKQLSLLDNVISPSRMRWSLDKCRIESEKYKTRGEWAANSRKSYQSAIVNGWIEVLRPRFGNAISFKEKSKKIIRSDGQMFESIRAAARFSGLHQSNITNCLKGKLNHTGGYTWKYIEKEKQNEH